jgi:radical SAM protein (TIGR01212 family)
MNASSLPFRTLAPWLRETFGRPVRRIALDAGSTCPNRDGTRARGGCTYCDVEGSGTGALRSGLEIAEQLRAGMKRLRRQGGDTGAIAYFQSYSNTYVSVERLEEMLSVLSPHIGDPIVAISIATRPDTLPEDALDLLSRWNQRIPIWVELGLESADDQVLSSIRRFHTVVEFEDAVARCHGAGLLTVGHAILGLPGDGRAGARRTARCLARSCVAGVKVHHLMVLRRTQMAHDWREGKLKTIDAPTYIDWLADFVERLRPEQILHRLTGDAPGEKLLAPHWDVKKNAIRDGLEAELILRASRQGALSPTLEAGA